MNIIKDTISCIRNIPKTIIHNKIHLAHIAIYVAIGIIYLALAIEYEEKQGKHKPHYWGIFTLYILLGLLGVVEICAHSKSGHAIKPPQK